MPAEAFGLTTNFVLAELGSAHAGGGGGGGGGGSTMIADDNHGGY